MEVSALISYLDQLLDSAYFKDPSYNGLQVAGTKKIKKIVTACTASLEAIDMAVENEADALIVHHGLFWKGADPRLVGNYYERVKSLIKHDINLIAYHLPLDAHLTYGNNAVLAHMLGGEAEYIVPQDKSSIAVRTKLAEPLTVSEIGSLLSQKLDTNVQVIGNVSQDIMLDDLAICSGSGSFVLDNNKTPDFQALITGDVNEQTYHMANETGTIVFVLGHHASEQVAINLLGEHLAKEFKLELLPTHFSYEKDVLVYNSNSD